MHIPGMLGMPRRIYTYEPGRGWDIWNLIVTIGVVFQAAGVLVFVGNLLWSYFPRQSGRERSLGRLDARMVHQLRRRPHTTSPYSRGQEPPAAVGPEASGRSRLAIRVAMSTSHHRCSRASDSEWRLPARGPVAMYCLIAAESAIFTIFVVAYIFYIGKSLPGPQPAATSCMPPSFSPSVCFRAA